jgi:preprotein translocase subunit SecA
MDWEIDKLVERYKFLTGRDLEMPSDLPLAQQSMFDALRDSAHQIYQEHTSTLDSRLAGLSGLGIAPQLNQGVMGRDMPMGFEVIEQDTMLEVLDYFWRHHLQDMDHLREGIGLRGYAQKNPLYEYQKEGFVLFQQMLEEMKESVIRRLFYYDVPRVEDVVAHFEEERRRNEQREKQMTLTHGEDLDEDPGQQDAEGDSARLPEDEKARLEAQRKARRKASKK